MSGECTRATPEAAVFGRVLAAWVGASRRRPLQVFAVAVVLALASVFYAHNHLGINTDTADMIAADIEWRQTYIEFKRVFPRFVDTLLIVVDGETPDIADRASRTLAAALATDHALVQWVMHSGSQPFFERNALLYLTQDELDDLSSRLAEAQPFLGVLAAEPNLAGFAKLFERVSTASALDRSRIDLTPALDAIADAANAERDGRFFEVSWRTLLAGDTGPGAVTRQFVVVKPKLDYGELLPAGPILARTRSLARELGLVPGNGVRVRVTGDAALAHEELKSVSRGAEIAGGLALVMVSVVLIVGLGSWRLVLASLGTLLIGLAWTAGFATAAVGSLNLISVAFAVLYIGLGADYAIHLSLRYRELVNQGSAHGAALDAAAGDVGASLVLCAITTGIGFYAFIPTEFAGVSELGIIAGTSMFISLVTTLTVLPALLTLMPLTPRRGVPGAASSGQSRSIAWASAPRRFRVPVITLAVVAGLGALAVAQAVKFDDNPLNLRDPEAQSVATYRDLLATGDPSPWNLSVLQSGFAEAGQLAQRLEALESVKEVRWAATLVPENQPAKFDRIEDLALMLGPELEFAAPVSDLATDGQRAGFDRLRRAIAALAAGESPPRGASRAQSALDGLAIDIDDAAVQSFERRLTGALPAQIELLSQSFDAPGVTIDAMPSWLREQWIAGDGRYRLEIHPSENIEPRPALVRFITEVQRIAPTATGTPLVNLKSGESIAGAFIQALASAIVLVIVVLMALLKPRRDAFLVVCPLLLAGACTVAIMVTLDMAFNFANVIALPLLLGIGVDNGVHIVHRARVATGPGGVLATSTPRAVLASVFTTICGFGSLALSPHPGMASMGAILTIGLVVMLVCTLVVLPAIMASGGSQTTR